MKSEDIQEVCARVFAAIDMNGKGSISRDQVTRALRMLNLNPIDSEIELLLVDKEYTYAEFVTLVTEKIRLPTVEEEREDLRTALSVFDKANIGMIEKEVFIAILTRLGEMKVTEQEAITWTEHLDTHKDGKLRINELEELFTCDGDIMLALSSQKWDLV